MDDEPGSTVGLASDTLSGAVDAALARVGSELLLNPVVHVSEVHRKLDLARQTCR